jgi:hypothetical protein
MRTTTTLLCLSALLTLNAQTTALDFTANDCDGVPHNLFSELDAGNAVVLELVMMGCQPCVDAAHSITDNVLPNVSDPTRVKYYSIGFTNSITCAQINNWKNTNGFTHQVFAGMSAQTTYYGGMGMPTIIVLGGGSTHGVYYSELGHSDSDDPTIISAINSALSDANSVEELSSVNVSISPNPTSDALTISGGTWTSARVLDLQGREVLSIKLNGTSLDVAMLQPGAYILYLSNARGANGVARFEKR